MVWKGPKMALGCGRRAVQDRFGLGDNGICNLKAMELGFGLFWKWRKGRGSQDVTAVQGMAFGEEKEEEEREKIKKNTWEEEDGFLPKASVDSVYSFRRTTQTCENSNFYFNQSYVASRRLQLI